MTSKIIKMMAQRITLSLLILLTVSALIFIGTEILPGDVAQSILGQSATPEALANLREKMGMNEPAVSRYLNWLVGILHGDLGNALTNGQDIAKALSGRMANTLFLASVAAVVSIPLAILLGLLAVRFRDRWPDKLISAGTLASISLPEFFIGYVLIYLFAVKIPIFPSVASVYSSMGLSDRLMAVALPAATLTLVVLAHMMRMTRAAILNVMESPYIETAELKGLSLFRIIYHHALPNAIAPIVNVVTLNLAYLIVGVVVIEVIFVYPGMGQYLVDHVSKRDVPVVQATGLIFAAIFIGLNLLADIIAIISNPRLRHPK